MGALVNEWLHQDSKETAAASIEAKKQKMIEEATACAMEDSSLACNRPVEYRYTRDSIEEEINQLYKEIEEEDYIFTDVERDIEEDISLYE